MPHPLPFIHIHFVTQLSLVLYRKCMPGLLALWKEIFFVGNGKLIFLCIWPQKWYWSSTLSHTSAHLDSSLCHGLVMWGALFCRGMACSSRLVLSWVMEGPSWTLTGLEKQPWEISHHLFSMLLGLHITFSQPTLQLHFNFLPVLDILNLWSSACILNHTHICIWIPPEWQK